MDSGLKNALQHIANEDVEVLEAKGATYGDSWKRRGGVGAFMMLARKWDRIENVSKVHKWDIFAAGSTDNVDSVLDDIADLRRYLMLVEVEVRALARDCYSVLADRAIAAERDSEQQSMREHAASIRSQGA